MDLTTSCSPSPPSSGESSSVSSGAVAAPAAQPRLRRSNDPIFFSILISMFIVISFLAVPESRRVIGTLARRARMLTTYAFYVRWSIGVQLILDGLHLWAFFSQSRQTLIDRCVDGSTDQEVLNICEQSFDTGKWTLVISMVIGLIIQLCECFPPPVGGLGKRGGRGCLLTRTLFFFSQWAAYIVTSYAKKLQEQQLWRSGPGIAPMHDHGPKYAPVRGDQESNIPLTGPSHSYPYRDTSHSFGNAAHHPLT
jgi:hypothetical protein